MFPTLIMLAVPCWVSLVYLVSPCNVPDDIVAARAPGDIIIGGLFPVHKTIENLANRTQPGPLQCSGFDPSMFLHVQTMIYTIEQINNSTFLPDIKLGYEIYDSCSNVIAAIQATQRFLSKFNSSDSRIEVHCNYTKYNPNVKAVIGGFYSEISIVVARLLNLYLIPQVSYGSTAETLSDKTKFASFLRTIPNVNHQTNAITKLMQHLNWKRVAVIASDDAYGRAGLNSVISHAAWRNICVEFHELIPIFKDEYQKAKINATAEMIIKSTVRVIIAFVRSSEIIKLFTILIQRNISKIWIASNVWSTSQVIASINNIEKIGTILGFTFKGGTIPNFKDYLKKLQSYPSDADKIIKDYINFANRRDEKKPTRKNSNSQGNKSQECYQIVEIFNEPGIYGVYLAVKAIAYALQEMFNCTQGNCNQNFNFPPWQLLNELKNVKFKTDNEQFEFDSSGDFSNGYDIIKWKMENGSTQFVNVGNYDVKKQMIAFCRNLAEVPTANCSQSCRPGEKKTTSTKHFCCFECNRCPAGSYSEKNNSNDCNECPEDYWSEAGRSKCQPRSIEFLQWKQTVSVVLTIFVIFGVLIICVILTLFIKHWHTPAVKAAGGWMCYIMLFSLVLGLISVVFFLGEPLDYICKIRQPLFGISFTLCVSCILLKSFRIILAFSFNPSTHKKLKSLYKPVPVIIVITGIQVVICSMWLSLKAPKPVQNKKLPQIILLLCDEGSYVAFVAMLGYIAFLAFVCFILAFKGRKAPEKFNEAKFITFSMLVYLTVWISFSVIYVNVGANNKYYPVIEAIAILASIYSILCCHFIPTCYIVYFKKESNVESNYLTHAREHFKQKGQFVCPVTNMKRHSGQPSSLTQVIADSEFECQVNQRFHLTNQNKDFQNQTLESTCLRKRHRSV
ncbi:G-protein coupled receptor family C group 6 member A-like [Rhincodon typus]|uniref:G-protein coupled receptor family C group 6 member A-like n=1 Tax=Rhincodon typus TaxID=259920 RepID=UPI00202E14CB|nr:G-protein coupled receptor family C group 6 member A-like [Rhincodon typus]